MAGLSVHDPIHGTIAVSAAEMALIDRPAVQRLRFIKQLGFAEMAFPGATHSRLAHSLGAMHMVGRIFDEVMGTLALPTEQRLALRQALRLAVLFHDLGHPPLSHASEQGMPLARVLGLGAWQSGAQGRQACHEDYTLKLILDSPLSADIAQWVGGMGVTCELIAALIAGSYAPEGAAADDLLMWQGLSLRPMLGAMVSGELDADRMDYLRRDATFVGVSYGHFDHLWLTSNMTAYACDEGWMLGLGRRAIWALENFLLARYHMFLAVYHHHTAVAFDTMLGAWFAETGFVWPAEPEAFVACDDMTLWQSLRASPSRWARDLTARRPLCLLQEVHLWHEDAGAAEATAGAASELFVGGGKNTLVAGPSASGAESLAHSVERLRAAGLTPMRVRSDSLLSRYARPGALRVPLVMAGGDGQLPQPIDAHTPLYRRFAQVARVERLFCPPDERRAAQEAIRGSGP